MAPWTWILTLLFCTVWAASPAFAQRAKPGDFPWRLRLVVSNESQPFHGVLKFDVYFDSKSDRHQTVILEAKNYEPGSVVSFLKKLSEVGMSDTLGKIEASVIGASQNCSSESLTVTEISLTSFHKRRTFLKSFSNDSLLVLAPQCGNSSNSSHLNVTVSLDSFQTMKSQDCYYQGLFYESDQSFDIGCEMRCRCKESMVDCDSMCKPPSTPLPRNCRMASIDRKCCDESECMEDALWDSCPVHTAARDRMPPWAVILIIPQGRNQSEGKRTCGASIIHKRLLITSAHCVRSSQYTTDPIDSLASINVSSSNSNGSTIAHVKSIHIHPSYSGKDAAADLALVELAQDGIAFGETIKRVNLPWPTLCKRYVVSGCAVQYTTVDDFDSYVGTVVSTTKFCPFAVSNHISQQKLIGKSELRNGTDPMFCVQRVTDGLASRNVGGTAKKCDQENGNGLVTKRAQFHYIIGVTAHQYQQTKPDILAPKVEAVIDQIPESRPASPIRTKRGDQASSSIDQQQGSKTDAGTDGDWRACGRQYIPVISLCPHIDWLKNTINELLTRD